MPSARKNVLCKGQVHRNRKDFDIAFQFAGLFVETDVLQGADRRVDRRENAYDEVFVFVLRQGYRLQVPVEYRKTRSFVACLQVRSH